MPAALLRPASRSPPAARANPTIARFAGSSQALRRSSFALRDNAARCRTAQQANRAGARKAGTFAWHGTCITQRVRQRVRGRRAPQCAFAIDSATGGAIAVAAHAGLGLAPSTELKGFHEVAMGPERN